MKQRKKILFSLSLVGMIGFLCIALKQSTDAIRAAEEESIEWLDTTELSVISPEESIEDVALDKFTTESITDDTIGSIEDTMVNETETRLEEVSPRAIVTSNWGTAPVSFDTATGILTVSAGTISTSARDKVKFLDASQKIVKSDVKKIILQNGVVADVNASYLFGGANLPSTSESVLFDNLVSITGFLDTKNVENMNSMFYGAKKLTTVDVNQWNTSKVTLMDYVFYNCSSLTTLNVSRWDTSKVTTMKSMFHTVSSVPVLDVGKWDTSKVTDMSNMFNNVSSVTSLDVSNWNTSNVTNMSSMFSRTSSITSLDVSNWNTANVTAMSGMFSTNTNLTSLDVSKFDTSKVTSMAGMFFNCSSLEQIDVSHWDTRNVESMYNMFSGTSNLADLDVNNWNTSKVTNMSNIFQNTSNLTNLNLSNWNTSKVTNMSNMFTGTTKLNTLTLGSNSIFNSTVKLPTVNKAGGIYTGGWDRVVPEKPASVYVSSSNFMSNYDGSMPGTYEWETVVIDSSWGTSPVLFDRTTGILTVSSGTLEAKQDSGFLDTKDKINKTAVKEIVLQNNVIAPENSNYLFSGSVAGGGAQFTNLVRISGSLDTTATTKMQSMFSGAISLKEVDVRQFDTSNVTDMSGMFREVTSMETVDVSQFNTSSVTTMLNMFYGSASLTTLNVSQWDTSKVTTMAGMFYQSASLDTIDVSKWNTTNVRNMSTMFSGVASLNELDLTGWDTSSVTNMNNLFAGTNLEKLTLGPTSIFNSSVNLPAINTESGDYSGGWERIVPATPAVSYESSTAFMTDYDGSKPGTYVWQTAGDITITVPEVMAFKETNVPVSKQTKSLREDPDWAIKVTDQRANSLRNQWQMTARLAEPFTNRKDQTLESVLKFKAAANQPEYTLDAVNSVPIYQSTIAPDKVTDQEIRWSADTGFYLDFDAFGFYPTGDYTSVIEFSLESVPTS